MRAGMRPSRVSLIALVALLIAPSVPAQQVPERPAGGAVFKAGVDLVTVSAVVRDQKGRIVPNLSRHDFELLDGGKVRSITDFRADQAPVTLAILVDASGSMQVGSRLSAAREAATQLMAWLQPGRDEVAFYLFDSRLEKVRDFSRNAFDTKVLEGVEAFGLTSLYDATAEMARQVAARGGSHRGVIVLTDGIDTASRLTAAQVSGIASSIDVPVYIVAVVLPVDRGVAAGGADDDQAPAGELADLAQWTGGQYFVSTAPAHSSLAARRIVEELRHQYLIAFEPGKEPGWHPLELRARDRNLIVRARSGYIAGQSRSGS
jgi:VWFA-related protein